MTPGFGNRTRVTLVGGERSNHCAIPAFPIENNDYSQRGVAEEGLIEIANIEKLDFFTFKVCFTFT